MENKGIEFLNAYAVKYRNDRESIKSISFLSNKAIENGDFFTLKYLIHGKFFQPSVELNHIEKAFKKGYIEIIDLILKETNCSINHFFFDNWTSLHFAARYNNTDLIHYILTKKDVNVNARNKQNKTPLHIATFDDNFDAVKALCECKEIDLNAQDNEGFSPIHYAAEKGFFDIVQFLASKENCNTNQVSKYGFTPIFNAAIYNHFDIVRYLSKSSGFDPNYKRESTGDYLIKIVMKNKKIEQIEFVCSLQGVDINIADNSLKTPLFYAIATGSLEIVRYICNIQNVNYNVINLAGETPLSFAQKREKSSPEMAEIIQLLRERM